MAKTKSEIQKDYEKRSNYAAKMKYDKKNFKSVMLKVHTRTEQDIIQKLATVPNKSGYIKNLIRQDINNTDPPNH